MPYLGRGAQPMGCVRGDRGATSSSGAQNRTYALADLQNLEAFPEVVMGTLSIFSFDLYALINLGPTLSYATPLVAGKFERIPELLVKPFEVSTPVGESIIARRVYRNCIVNISGCDTMADLVEL